MIYTGDGIEMFSPPYGDGTDIIKQCYEMKQLSPPYGDGTLCTKFYHAPVVFSPPCGDCTHTENGVIVAEKFSPPYGDGIYNERVRNLYCLFFVPLRGLYVQGLYPARHPQVFAPLRGLYPKYITKHRKTEGPDG